MTSGSLAIIFSAWFVFAATANRAAAPTHAGHQRGSVASGQ
jgi:hypothetical protein